MIDLELFVALASSLREQVRLLRPIQRLSLKELTDEPIRWNGVLHLLQVSVEHVTDIGAHILAGSDLGVPPNHREIIVKLGQMGILPLDLRNALRR